MIRIVGLLELAGSLESRYNSTSLILINPLWKKLL
jgi:hypothetical protein